MKYKLFFLTIMMCTSMVAVAQISKDQQIKEIRRIYAEAKAQISQNGKNGKAPLDMKISLNDGTQVDEDFAIDEEKELTFYFNKYRTRANLDYPDASRCYFIVEDWGSHGHIRYREILFDPNKGHLLFCYMRHETDAGFVVETRYYYDAHGRLIDQKHKVGGHDAAPGTHNWNDGSSEKDQAMSYLSVFETLMNAKGVPTGRNAVKQQIPSKAEQLKQIRGIYAQAKEKIAKNDQSELPHDMKVIIHDQSWGPPEITDLKFYFDDYCYFISNHRHHNNMGSDIYSEYLFAPHSHHLIFSYTNAKEEGEQNEWRYYYDEKGQCIEVKTNSTDQDAGKTDQAQVARYLKVFQILKDS
jgi:hypothetical protein